MDFQQILDYSAALAAHNDRAWFHENHQQYEAARADYLALLEILRIPILQNAPALEKDIFEMPAKDWVYRIARDMRYSHNLPPYDPAFRAYVCRDRRSNLPLGYYISIFPGKSIFGAGLWCENTAASNRARDYIEAHLAQWERLVEECGLPITGDRLKTMPRGYDVASPAAPWLRYKSWAVIADLPDAELTTFENLAGIVGGLVRRMEPLRQLWLTIATGGPGQEPAPEDFFRE